MMKCNIFHKVNSFFCKSLRALSAPARLLIVASVLFVIAFCVSSCSSVWKADVEGKMSIEYNGTGQPTENGSLNDDVYILTKSK